MRRLAIIMTHTLAGHFIRNTILIPGRASLCSQTATILLDMDSTRNISFEIVVHVDMIASRRTFML